MLLSRYPNMTEINGPTGVQGFESSNTNNGTEETLGKMNNNGNNTVSELLKNTKKQHDIEVLQKENFALKMQMQLLQQQGSTGDNKMVGHPMMPHPIPGFQPQHGGLQHTQQGQQTTNQRDQQPQHPMGLNPQMMAQGMLGYFPGAPHMMGYHPSQGQFIGVPMGMPMMMPQMQMGNVNQDGTTESSGNPREWGFSYPTATAEQMGITATQTPTVPTEKKRARASSKYRGVYWNKNCKAWRARIWVNGKSEHLGNFDDEEEAARAFDKRASELNRLSSLNFPNDQIKSQFSTRRKDVGTSKTIFRHPNPSVQNPSTANTTSGALVSQKEESIKKGDEEDPQLKKVRVDNEPNLTMIPEIPKDTEKVVKATTD